MFVSSVFLCVLRGEYFFRFFCKRLESGLSPDLPARLSYAKVAPAFKPITKFIGRVDMPRIVAEVAEGTKTFEADEGRKLVLAIEDHGIDILHRCGGNARCTTCRVEVLEGDPGEKQELERNRLAVETGLAENVRLSCQVRVHDDLHVRVINQSSVRGIPPGPRPVD
jgi:ferredoxin